MVRQISMALRVESGWSFRTLEALIKRRAIAERLLGGGIDAGFRPVGEAE